MIRKSLNTWLSIDPSFYITEMEGAKLLFRQSEWHAFANSDILQTFTETTLSFWGAQVAPTTQKWEKDFPLRVKKQDLCMTRQSTTRVWPEKGEDAPKTGTLDDNLNVRT